MINIKGNGTLNEFSLNSMQYSACYLKTNMVNCGPINRELLRYKSKALGSLRDTFSTLQLNIFANENHLIEINQQKKFDYLPPARLQL